MLYAIVGLLVVIVDQWVKYWVSGAINPESTGETFIPGILSLVNVHNDGAAFGFLAGSNARIPFIIITGVFIVAVILALATKFISGRFARWCLVLVTAGGLGNCIDRVIYGYVQDMFKCELFNFPIFNVADVFITVFAILFVLAVLFERKTVYDDLEDEELIDDEDEDDEYEDEQPRPSRRALKARKREARRAARAEKDALEDEEDDEDEDDFFAPPPQRPARKTRKERAEEAYQQAQAEAEAARRKAEAAAEARRKAEAEAAARRQAEEDAAARRQAEQARAARRRAEAAPRPQQTVEDPFAAWEAANAKLGTQQQPGRPARGASQAQPETARPAPRHAAPSKPAAAEDEFSLDDILAEFK